MDDNQRDRLLFLARMLSQGKITKQEYDRQVEALIRMVPLSPETKGSVARNQKQKVKAGQMPGASGMLPVTPPPNMGEPLNEQMRRSNAPPRPEFDTPGASGMLPITPTPNMGEPLNEQMRGSNAPPRPEFDRDRDIGFGQNVPEPERDIGENPLPSIAEIDAGARQVPGRSEEELAEYMPPDESMETPEQQAERLQQIEDRRADDEYNREMRKDGGVPVIDKETGQPVFQPGTGRFEFRPDDERYEGMSQDERDIAMLQDAEPTQAEIDAEVAKEEAKSAAGLAKRKEVESLKTDPTKRLNEKGEVEAYPEEVELWIGRNKTQADMNVSEENKELWTMGQRQRREGLRDIAVGQGLRGRSATEFEYWKQSGGKWPGPYTSMSREAIAAAQAYYLEFGQPKPTFEGSPRKMADPNQMSFEEFKRRQEAGEFDTPPSISPEEQEAGRERSQRIRDSVDRDRKRSVLRQMQKEGIQLQSGYNTVDGAFSSEQEREIADYLRVRGYSDANDWYRDTVRASRDTRKRDSQVRAILRRDPEERKELLDRINRNRPPGDRIRPEEIGLPGRQVVGEFREVKEFDRISGNNAIEGEYLKTDRGRFRVASTGKEVDGKPELAMVPVRQVRGGKYVPDADSIDFETFNDTYSGGERRTVAALARAERTGSVAEEQRRIDRSRERINSSDEYDEATKKEALKRLEARENKLHYEYLQNVLEGDSDARPLPAIPAETEYERGQRLKNEKTERDLEKEGGSGDTTDDALDEYLGGGPARGAGQGTTLWPRLVEKFKEDMASGVPQEEALGELLRRTDENWDRIREEESARTDNARDFVTEALTEGELNP
tara:strand:+ start:13858 stop:16368 length:2511 start_codon:yes stop_codon:yes gene_type:complete